MFVRHNLFCVIWVLIILFLSLTPGSEVPEFSWKIIPFDIVVHVAVYAILSHAMMVGFNKQQDFPFLKRKSFWIVLVASFILGVLLEFFQILVEGRFFDLKDVLANLLGVFLGLIAFKIVYRKIV